MKAKSIKEKLTEDSICFTAKQDRCVASAHIVTTDFNSLKTELKLKREP